MTDMPNITSDKVEPKQPNPDKVTRLVNLLFSKVKSQFSGDIKYSQLITAVRNLISEKGEEYNLTPQDITTLESFIGPSYTTRLITCSDNILPLVESLLTEDVPAINNARATTLAFWFDMLMMQLRKEKIDKAEFIRLARRTGFELINALADRHIRT